MESGPWGEIVRLRGNIIQWSFDSDYFPRAELDRIYSPQFYYQNKRPVQSVHGLNLEVDNGWIGLIVCITKRINVSITHLHGRDLRIVMKDQTSRTISCTESQSIQHSEGIGYIKYPKFIRQTDMLNSYLMLFCEMTKQKTQMLVVSTQTEKIFGFEKLIQNLEDLYVKGVDSDLTIKVKDHHFKAHKAILRTRSSVFYAMFSHDLAEVKSGVVPIEDCEPDIFEEFLYFVYTAKTRNLSSNNMFDLYYVADKYDLPELKEECVSFIKKSWSIETICDVICLATKHNEIELLELATAFFTRNIDEILITNKWQLFLIENPIQANELYIKALKLGFRKIKF